MRSQDSVGVLSERECHLSAYNSRFIAQVVGGSHQRIQEGPESEKRTSDTLGQRKKTCRINKIISNR